MKSVAHKLRERWYISVYGSTDQNKRDTNVDKIVCNTNNLYTFCIPFGAYDLVKICTPSTAGVLIDISLCNFRQTHSVSVFRLQIIYEMFFDVKSLQIQPAKQINTFEPHTKVYTLVNYANGECAVEFFGLFYRFDRTSYKRNANVRVMNCLAVVRTCVIYTVCSWISLIDHHKIH